MRHYQLVEKAIPILAAAVVTTFATSASAWQNPQNGELNVVGAKTDNLFSGGGGGPKKGPMQGGPVVHELTGLADIPILIATGQASLPRDL